jgi:hypothetical protein
MMYKANHRKLQIELCKAPQKKLNSGTSAGQAVLILLVAPVRTSKSIFFSDTRNLIESKETSIIVTGKFKVSIFFYL